MFSGSKGATGKIGDTVKNLFGKGGGKVASTVGRTYTNALHIAVSLYLDIINLFLTLVSIFGDND
jgi:FtsH-binding integral membrane protein